MKFFLLSMMVLTFAFWFSKCTKYDEDILRIGISTSNIDSKSDWVEYEFHTGRYPFVWMSTIRCCLEIDGIFMWFRV